MKKNLVLTFLLAAGFSPAFSQLPAAARSKAIIAKRVVEKNHLSARAVNDSFSSALFEKMIYMADRRSLLFTEPGFKALSAFRYSLDDELNGRGWNFLPAYEDIYRKALLRADSVIQELSKKPFDFLVAETVTLAKKNDEQVFAANEKELTARWLRFLKFRALDQLYDIYTDENPGKLSFKQVIASHEAKVRERVCQPEQRLLKKVLEHPSGFSAYITERYLDMMTTCFDPHSNYFSPQGKEDFSAALSGEELSFGIELDENEKGEIVISQLMPGGPAWKSGEMNKGDELLSLHWEGRQEEEVRGMDLDDVYDILDEPVQGRLVFRFRKADGSIRTVLLRKERVESDENIVKSFILGGDKKIGYILLPGFYTEWENESGSSCANDVAKEIVKLKKENIQGLILDLRYNGGGSMGEAMELLGIFIDEGPLFAQKQKDGKLISLKDPNRGTIYNGPLAVMVNGQSASASEVVAASLQDYNRAVIVGSNSYGKASMQQMFALDTITSKPGAIGKGKDMLKITTGKLYRLNGGSAQLYGVTPDILLPDAFDWLDYREKFSPFALQPETVAKNNYYKPLPPLPVAELSRLSIARTSSSSSFATIRKQVQTMKAMMEKTETIPLQWESYLKWAEQQERSAGPVTDENGQETKKFAVENHKADKELLVNNGYAREINAEWLSNIKKNIYIEEAFLVLCDLINLQAAKN